MKYSQALNVIKIVYLKGGEKKTISDDKKESFQFPPENGNVGGIPAFKQDDVPKFRCCMLKRKEKKNDTYRVLRIHIMIELLMCFHKLVAGMKLLT